MVFNLMTLSPRSNNLKFFRPTRLFSGFILATALFLPIISRSYSSPFKLHREYCSVLANCGITYDKDFCPDSLSAAIQGVDYDSLRCSEVQRLSQSRIPYSEGLKRKVFGFLGNKYRVEYNISDTLPVKLYQFEFLLDHLPLTAKIINVFQKTKYTIEYKSKNKKYWKGNKGKNLYGEAILLTGGIYKKHLTYFGFGVVKIIKWKIFGPGLIAFNYTSKNGNIISYDMRVLVVPGNKVLNIIMKMSLFKKIVISVILDIFKDITNAANEFNNTPLEELLEKYTWTQEEKEQLQILFHTPK
ncbi:MAG: hypothetical protein HQK83_08215 [Fibrobacteria bacterium]|nr:hypothetical protein [Fibrobacteria bacterium]